MFLTPPIGLIAKKGGPPPVEFVGITGTTAASGGTLNLGLPGGVIEGDLMIAFMKCGRGGTPPTWSANDGAFTEHYDASPYFGTDTWNVACYSKVAGPSESAPYGFQNSNGMRQRQGMMVAYRNQHATPFDIAPTSLDLSNNNANVQNINIAGVSPAGDNGLLVLCDMREQGVGTSHTPTVDPATKRLWQIDTFDAALSMGVYDEQLTASGATGTRNIQYDINSDIVAFRMVIARA
jgi:hypothetical protein